MKREQALLVHDLVERIRPVLAGHPPEIQAAVLGDCVALWLAGHHIAGDEDKTRDLRATLLAGHCRLVRELVPVNAQLIGTTP